MIKGSQKGMSKTNEGIEPPPCFTQWDDAQELAADSESNSSQEDRECTEPRFIGFGHPA